MAEAILKSYNSDLEIYSAGLDPADHVSPIAIEVIAETGINLEPGVPRNYSEFMKMQFDYLITVGEGTTEELKLPEINYKRKLHLGFKSPYKGAKSQQEIKDRCRAVCDELRLELDYFYHNILKKVYNVR